ncbi:hypothetical protein RvY_09009 [Ramazzottius varieornatus]|uniref:Uncharacterized protein n=1 Tax=Ramazzottius varieornatus TaxID=947166 RepID=A0A1D1VCG9_RAMVA|nr:hypothetical protein RvY_09009 [Ramazzottius varieornatus]
MNVIPRSDSGYKRISGSAANVRHGSFTNDNVSNSGTSTSSLRSSQNFSRASGEYTPLASEIWAAPTQQSSSAALQNRAAIYDSFITAKADLKSPQLGTTNSDLAARNVIRSRSFYNIKALGTPEQHQRAHSDDIVDLEDPDSAASVTDVRVNIQREKSLRLLRGVAPSPHLTSSRTPSGSISYIAWDDSFHGVTLPPLKIWTEEALLQFGHTAYHDENLSQITDYLYIGDIYAANNEHLLCRLNVDAIVDLSNLRPEDLRKLKACHIPCTCPVNANHQRAKLIIGVKNSEAEEIAAYFDEINRFIECKCV